jgi:Kef-type K+ transport system membrane component KefB
MEQTRFFIAIVLLIFAGQAMGHLFQRIKLPKVIGEITGGLLLGPTFLGFFAPEFFSWIFNAFTAEGKLISMISQLGLMFLMFVSGLYIQKGFSKQELKITSALPIAGTILPFLAGVAATFLFDFSVYAGPQGNPLSLLITIGVAFAVTSIPVISKIFMDLGIMNTRFAKIVLWSASGEDIVLFGALAIAAGIAGATNPVISDIIYSGLITAVFVVSALYGLPRLIRATYNSRANFIIKSFPVGYAIFITLFLVSVGNLLNVNLVLTAFLAGIAIGRLPDEIFGETKDRIRAVSLGFFTPVYFAVVGLKLDLIQHFDMALLFVFMLFSTAAVTASTFIVSKIMKLDWLSGVNLAVALNARGGPGIVVATLAFDFGIINEAFFVTLVLTAMITSLFAGYWLRYVLSKGWPLLKLADEPSSIQGELNQGNKSSSS